MSSFKKKKIQQGSVKKKPQQGSASRMFNNQKSKPKQFGTSDSGKLGKRNSKGGQPRKFNPNSKGNNNSKKRHGKQKQQEEESEFEEVEVSNENMCRMLLKYHLASTCQSRIGGQSVSPICLSSDRRDWPHYTSLGLGQVS